MNVLNFYFCCWKFLLFFIISHNIYYMTDWFQNCFCEKKTMRLIHKYKRLRRFEIPKRMIFFFTCVMKMKVAGQSILIGCNNNLVNIKYDYEIKSHIFYIKICEGKFSPPALFLCRFFAYHDVRCREMK